ncbi:insulin-like peptide isoform X1 [Bombyx mori]|uniref:Insulin-like domain-containing protein n=2 Tax=Bombyx mori TaxID=7091 RepID=A0A8R2GCF3_BOMMO|nr:insulin-like peptide isoform X1 [Bombyx mori]
MHFVASSSLSTNTTMFLLYFLIVVALVSADVHDKELKIEENPRVYCGRHLANARMVLCYDTVEKRAQSYLDANIISAGDLSSWPGLSSQYAKTRAFALAEKSKRGPGLVDECCLKPCYTYDLLNYC